LKEQAAYLWMIASAGVLNGVGQVVMRWGGRDAKVPFSLHNIGDWATSSRWWILGLFVSWTSGVLWALLLRHVRLVIALPIFVGTAYTLTVLGGLVLLAERPTVSQYLGMLLVIAGILLIVLRK
jgi:multidrug transporter EmrE-like cation transporter